jgi:hypothetical protein
MTTARPESPPHSAGRIAFLLLAAQFALIWATFFILSGAIGWPASLRDPAAITLPRLLEHRGAVLAGYGCYLAAALLMVPAVAALNARFGLRGQLGGLALALAAIAASAKTIGIGRWLFAMPGLAAAQALPGADQASVALLFQALNDYAGGIGEVVGVGIASGALTLLLAFAVGRDRGRPARALGAFAGLSGLALLATVPAGFGVPLGPVLTVSNTAWQFALLGLGVRALRRPGA